MAMMECVIDAKGLAEADFGAGDDPHKSHWMSKRRKLWGLGAFEPRTVREALGAIRHIGGTKVKYLVVKFTSTGPQR